jgi:hypothetical protein
MPLGLREVEAPTLHSAHRWHQGCQPYAPADFYPQEDSWYSFLLEAELTPGRLEGFGKLKKSTSSGIRTGDLPVCSIVSQPTTLPRAPKSIGSDSNVMDEVIHATAQFRNLITVWRFDFLQEYYITLCPLFNWAGSVTYFRTPGDKQIQSLKLHLC